MKADRESFIEQASILNRDAILALAISLYDELENMRLKQLENERISTEAHIQFLELKTKHTAAIAEIENLKALLQKEIEKNTLKTKSTFGRKTEGILSMLDAADNPEEEPADESETEDTEKQKRKKRVIDFFKAKKARPSRRNTTGGEKGNGQSLAHSLDALPRQPVYDIDVDALNEQYDQGQWRNRLLALSPGADETGLALLYAGHIHAGHIGGFGARHVHHPVHEPADR